MLKFHPLRLLDSVALAEDAHQIRFAVPPQLQGVYTGRPGQHIVVKAMIDGSEIRRPYSLVSVPGEFPLRIGVRLHDRGRMSRYLAEHVRPGARLEVLPPNGSFVSRLANFGERRYVGFAAGCGITPILAIVRAKLEREPRSSWVLFCGNRNAARTMFLEELLSLKNRYLQRLSLHFIMSREPQEVALYNGRLDREKAKRLADAFFVPAAIDEFFICGPDDMISAVSHALAEAGVDEDRVHTEHFTLQSVVACARPEEAPAALEGIAEVTVIMDGRRRSFSMAPGAGSLLEAAIEAGVELPYSCCAGVCSTCRTKVVKGDVEMLENHALEDWEVEQGYVLACQSRPLTREIALDYDHV